MYKILGADQKEYQASDADQLRQWIAARRVNGRTKVQAEGSPDWKSLSDLPEFSDALAQSTAATSPATGRPLSPPALPSDHVPSRTLAITSLILGIVSVVPCSIFTGVPAIITGHIAHARSRKAPGQFGGAGMAIAGWLLGYASLAIFTIIMIGVISARVLPALNQAKSGAQTRAQSINCVSNLKQIGLSVRTWSDDNDDKFPPDFSAMSTHLPKSKFLSCTTDNSVTYEYLSPGDVQIDGEKVIILRCPLHGHVGFSDGTVEQGKPLPTR